MGERPQGSWFRRVAWVLAALLVVAGGLALYLNWEEITGSDPGDGGTPEASVGPSPSAVAVTRFSGDGDETTERFEVTNRWHVHWEAEGDTFRLSILGGGYGQVLDEEGPSSGSVVAVSPGEYRLEIESDGPWTIRVTQEGDV